MLVPLSNNARRRPVSTVVTIPAPIGGWNARDALTAMAQTDAIQLDNWIPDAGGVRLRHGFASHATGMGAPVESLMEYNPPSGNPSLFGATGDTIWDVTGGGDATDVKSGLSNGRWQHTMFATIGGNYLCMVNGADGFLTWDGSDWTTQTITGADATSFVNVAVHMNRLWFIPENSLDVWYLGTSSVAGAATQFQLGPLCRLGGKLLAMGSWTRDGGAGMDDMAVFVTTKGEAIIYSGTDPASSDTWQMQGIFRIPEPVGRRCLVKTGADIGLITSQGVLPLSVILPLAASGAAKAAATDKISGAFDSAYAGASSAFGWQVIEYPKERLLIVNVPVIERSESQQFVMNTQTGAWCRFTGLNAECWSLLGDNLYFGAPNGKVYKYGGASSDDGEAINATSISAFSQFGTPKLKRCTMARPMVYGPSDYVPLLALRTDYDLGDVNYQATSLISVGSVWDEAIWDDAEWALGIIPSALWQSVSALGSVISVALAVSITDQMRFNSVDLMLEPGGYL